jgi:hypothetical protein
MPSNAHITLHSLPVASALALTSSTSTLHWSGMQQEAGGADHVSGEMEEGTPATWDCGSPLYDSFELVSLHHVLDRHLMILPFPIGALPRQDASMKLTHWVQP